MEDNERELLLDALTERLRVDGAPQGIWLVQITQVRQALRAADDLLLKIADAITTGLPPLN